MRIQLGEDMIEVRLFFRAGMETFGSADEGDPIFHEQPSGFDIAVNLGLATKFNTSQRDDIALNLSVNDDVLCFDRRFDHGALTHGQ